MKQLYEKSVLALKQYDYKPTVKEWNSLAKQYNLLCTKTMMKISGLNWNDLCKKTRKKN